jgi:hypothetical protein
MSLQKISAAGSVENALLPTFAPSKSRMEIEPVLGNQVSVTSRKVAGSAKYAWHRGESQRTEDGRQKTISDFARPPRLAHMAGVVAGRDCEFRNYNTDRSQQLKFNSRGGRSECLGMEHRVGGE